MNTEQINRRRRAPLKLSDVIMRIPLFVLPAAMTWYFILNDGYIPAKSGGKLYYSDRPFAFLFVVGTVTMMAALFSGLTIWSYRKGR
ncbi:hypothetical protein [Novosphingobium sp.]|uniref:hypothetical protein n=1 Tax=Novosphingobium sp. TaxID=1874826 RepID=UPI0025EDC95C|nr:hypothetical protein [Novosphingobium sp.]MCC6925879.1 hypothetical protein [Novosphingobium sp.]